MDTERPSPRFSGIDVWEPLDALDAMIEGQFAAVAAVRAARRDILRAVLAMEKRLASGGRLVYAGAGTSGRLAVQDGAELMPTFSWPKERLVLLLAGGDEAMVQAIEGAEDETHRAAELIRVEHGVGANDVLIAVAASGKTPFTLSALREAKKLGALTVGIANNLDTPLLLEADCPICLETGSEPIAGSTRMNAGTAQRVTLAMLSSLAMIRLGRVYEGLMVEVQAVNAKLVGRREKMLVHLTGKDLSAVRETLAQTGGNIKLAMLVLQGCALEEASALLERTGGRLREALTLAGRDGGAG